MKKIVKKLITKKNSEKSKLEKNQGGYEKKKGFVILPIFASTSPEVRRLSISGGTLTSKIPVWAIIGSVFIWHMYCPRSSSWTLVICKLKVVIKSPETEIRGSWVMTVSAKDKMALESDRTHPTCNKGQNNEILLNNVRKILILFSVYYSICDFSRLKVWNNSNYKREQRSQV